MNTENLIKEVVVASLQDDKFEIGSRIHDLLADDRTKDKYIISEKENDYTEEERTIDFNRKSGVLTIEYNADLSYVDDIIKNVCDINKYKVKFETEKPINTRIVTIPETLRNYKIYDNGKYDGSYLATSEERAIESWEDDTLEKAKDHKLIVKK